eukprot:scaffold16918_cov118-Isochrysis_galbana.AAC.3
MHARLLSRGSLLTRTFVARSCCALGRASFQAEGADAVWPAVSDPRQHPWAAVARTRATTTPSTSPVSTSLAASELSWVSLPVAPPAFGRAGTCVRVSLGLPRA